MTEHRRELEIFEASVEINETTYQQKSNWNGQCYNNYNNWNNAQGSKRNSYKGKSTYNNGPKVQCKFCFGPREIFQIWKLLDEYADNPDQYMKAKMANSTTEFIKNRMGNSAHIDEVELEAWLSLWIIPIEHVIHEINMFLSQKQRKPTKLFND